MQEPRVAKEVPIWPFFSFFPGCPGLHPALRRLRLGMGFVYQAPRQVAQEHGLRGHLSGLEDGRLLWNSS